VLVAVPGVDVPGQQLFDAINGVVGNVGEDVAQVGFWVEAVQLGRADQAVEGGGTLPSRIGASEEMDTNRAPVRKYIERWRLEKKDPAAAESDVVKPIEIYVDPATPTKWVPLCETGDRGLAARF